MKYAKARVAKRAANIIDSSARRRLVVLGGVAAIVLAACSANTDNRSVQSSNAANNTGQVDASVGESAPTYVTTSLDGDTVSLADLRGQVVILNVWATWCSPCRAEIPELQALHEKYNSKGLKLIGVSIDNEGTDGNVRRFIKNLKMTYPIWRDYDDGISSKFRIVGVPATFLIDREGIVRWKKTGPISPGDTSLSQALTRAIGS